MVVELSYFGGDLPDLPTLQTIFSIQYKTMLLLKFPQFRVNVERPSKIRLPLFMTVLWQIPKMIQIDAGNEDILDSYGCFRK